MATPSSTVSSSDTNDRSGLESIALVCLQALKQNQEEEKKNDHRDPSTTTAPTILCPPPPPSMELSSRVVSMESVGEDNDGDDGVLTSSQVSKNRGTEPQLTQRIQETSHNISIANEVGFSASASYANDSVSDIHKDNVSSFSSSSSTTAVATAAAAASNVTPQVADFSNILADPEGWFRQTENMFVKLPPIEQSSNDDAHVIVVQPNDVLCGRGGETNHHSGNVQYRSLVKAYQKLYLLAKRRDKPKIAQCIVISVRGVGGRFLKRVTTTAHGPGWADVGHVKAREKTSQALREGAPDLRQSSTNANKKGGTITATNNSNESGVVESQQQQVLTQTHQIEHGVTAAIPSAPVRFEALMDLRMPTTLSSNFNRTHISKNKTTKESTPSPSPSFLYKNSNDRSSPYTASPLSSESLPLSSSSIADKDAVLKTKAFTTAAANLMQHPIFHQLTLSQQQEAILHEFNAAARAAVTSTTTETEATRPLRTTSMLPPSSSPQPPSSSLTADNTQEGQQGRTSPPLMIQQQPPQFPHHPHHSQHQYYPPHIYGHGYSYYQRDQYGHYPPPPPPPYGHYPPHDGNNVKNDDNDGGDEGANNSCSSSTPGKTNSCRNVDLHSMYREVLVAKAAAAAGESGTNKTTTKIRTMKTTNNTETTCDDNINSNKKRKVPRLMMSPPTIVSDDSLSSTSSSLSTTITTINNNNNNSVMEGAGAGNSGGPRLKRLKLRLNNNDTH